MAATQSSQQKAFEKRAADEKAEYSTFRAKAPIYHEGTVAYQPGMPVPVSNVELYKYDEQGLVERVTGEDRVQAQQQAENARRPDEDAQ